MERKCSLLALCYAIANIRRITIQTVVLFVGGRATI